MEKEKMLLERKRLIVSVALSMLQNLAKIPNCKKFFRDPEVNALKWCDIYKGSQSTDRRIMSLLILSYIIDPETENDFAEDTQGVLDTLIAKLDEQLSGKANEFSIHELVEGLEKLSINPVNKGKIIAEGISSIQTVLLTGTAKEKKFAERALLTLGFNLDHMTKSDSESNTDKPNTALHEAVSQNIKFAQAMICVLEQLEDYTSEESIQALDVLFANACRNLSREEREIVAETLLEHNIEALLMKIMDDMSRRGQALYENNVWFNAFYCVLSIVVSYCDASLVFSEALAKVGGVKFAFGLCEKFYMERRQKMLAVTGHDKPDHEQKDNKDVASSELPEQHLPQKSTMVSENGDEIKTADTDKGDDTATSERHETCKPTDSERSQTQSKQDEDEKNYSDQSNSDGEYYFKLAKPSEVAEISKNGRQLVKKEHPNKLLRAVVVSNKFLETGVMFEIQVEELLKWYTQPQVEFGVTIHPTIPDDVTHYGNATVGKGTGYWVLWNCDFVKDFTLIGGGYKLNLQDVAAGDRVGIARYTDSTIHYFLNGKDMGKAFSNVPEDVYVFLSVGKWVKVSIMDSKKLTNLPTAEDEKPCDIKDEFTVHTPGGDQLVGRKLKFPYGADFMDPDQNPELHKHVAGGRPDIVDDKMLSTFEEIQAGMQKLCVINEYSAQKGYVSESDMEYLIDFTTAVNKIPVDPVSSIPMFNLNCVIHTVSLYIASCQRPDLDKNVLDIQERSRVTGRFADILQQVVKPCFDNLKSLDDYIWAGSTSEGFAFVDERHGVVSINDEMDMMVPIASVSEINVSTEITVSEMKISTHQLPSNVVSELEAVNSSLSAGCLLQWFPIQQPGYVKVKVTEFGVHNLSSNFLQNACIQNDVEKIHLLSRSKMLEAQENYVRQRYPEVQEELVEKSKGGLFTGKLQLVQEGPAQTLCVRTSVGKSANSDGEDTIYEQMVDVTLALTCTEWPSSAKPWITRERCWPDDDIVKRIVKEGSHIVPKAYPGAEGDLALDWRLSFSLAERTLAHTINEHQRRCYLVLKAFWRRYLQEPKVLSSYHLKTALFWRCEKTPQHLWNKDTMAERFIELLEDLIAFLRKKDIPNFFIPENNMLSHIPEDKLQEGLKMVMDLRCNMLVYLNKYNAYLTNYFSYSMQKQNQASL
ncbi:uncharacterized protein [Ptychodera flava]|uniref:uncharacterized protein n=1 Tax=Ptychodera flava TaxID=63121 RepID=UPI00396AA000